MSLVLHQEGLLFVTRRLEIAAVVDVALAITIEPRPKEILVVLQERRTVNRCRRMSALLIWTLNFEIYCLFSICPESSLFLASSGLLLLRGHVIPADANGRT